jgi:predicted phage baseplate assembly protein
MGSDKGGETPFLNNLKVIRNTSVLVQSEELVLVQQPLDRDVGKPAPPQEPLSESETRIELEGVIRGLTAGRFAIVTGERADLQGTTGVTAAELVMIAGVEVITNAGPAGKPYSILLLAPEGLRYEYKRSTVKIYGNVVKATHGETRTEILGAGNAATPLQTFRLHQSPLTFTAAPTVAGVVSTLAIRVNDVLWHQTDTFAGAQPTDRIFITRTADDGKVSVTFGNGREGARVPTGNDNIRAAYRSGIGKPGNVKAKQIATAISRPLGVRDVINPIHSSGGTNPESRDDARRNIPVSLQAMGRVVSVRDFADFARTFAGISKASAVTLTDGRRQVVHLTVGGAEDVLIDVTSDLYLALVEALRTFGDPFTPFVVAPYEKIVIAGSAGVRVHPDYLWVNVGPAIRAMLIETFSYDRRELGQAVYPAEVIAAIQNVPGVSYVDLDALGGIRSTNLVDFDAKDPDAAKLPKIISVNPIVPNLARAKKKGLRPAQLACLPADLAELFVLREIEHE